MINPEKIFKKGYTKLSGEDLEGLPIPFDITYLTDEKMQEIVNDIELYFTWRIKGKRLDKDSKSEIWWEEMEQVVVKAGVPYIEDYSDKEYEEYLERRKI